MDIKVKELVGNSTSNSILGSNVIHNFNNTNPYIHIKETLTNSYILTSIDYAPNSITIYGLESGIDYTVTIVG
jgi:hypothetical protein